MQVYVSQFKLNLLNGLVNPRINCYYPVILYPNKSKNNWLWLLYNYWSCFNLVKIMRWLCIVLLLAMFACADNLLPIVHIASNLIKFYAFASSYFSKHETHGQVWRPAPMRYNWFFLQNCLLYDIKMFKMKQISWISHTSQKYTLNPKTITSPTCADQLWSLISNEQPWIT